MNVFLFLLLDSLRPRSGENNIALGVCSVKLYENASHDEQLPCMQPVGKAKLISL